MGVSGMSLRVEAAFRTPQGCGYGSSMQMSGTMTACLLVMTLVTGLAAQAVPRVQVQAPTGGLCKPTAVHCEDPFLAPQVEAFVDGLRRLGVTSVAIAKVAPKDAHILVERVAQSPMVRYEIEATASSSMRVRAATQQAVAHAMATLLQTVEIADGQASWSGTRIEDHADLNFRCFMVDLGRNPHSPKVLRQIVDACWFYKVNYLQLHLTDDQLFSWPSRAYPKLHDERSGWTWDAFAKLEAYSQARGVTIIPEIDVPGHSTILRKRYPEVFGKSPTELATLPGALVGMKTLIDEMLMVFAATPYVHIGGDEAYGVPGDVQRDFVNSLNRHVVARGRRAIVWEGPRLGKGEHKIDTNVLHMNWRTIDFPAQEMLDAGYEVVNAAWDPLYIVDHYPRTMFTAVSVKRCYEWNLRRFAHVNHGMPTFAKPHMTNTSKGIVGFCMPWWEGREQKVMALCVPRLAAVADAAWNGTAPRDFAKFERDQQRLLPRLAKLSGATFTSTPFADVDSQQGNLAFRAKVHASSGMSQPVYGPDRLTNGLLDRFDHFLGFPTQPEPLEITVDLGKAQAIARVVVHETSVGKSHEIYELLVSRDGKAFEQVGSAKKGSRGDATFVEHAFDAREARYVRIATHGCHGLTFPSFSRLTEVQVFAK